MAVKNGFPDPALGNAYTFQDRYLELRDGHVMHYIEMGQKFLGNRRPTILLLHGSPTWSFLYRDFMVPLSRVARVIAVDHVGFGRSDHPSDPDYYTLEQHIKNLEEFAKILKLDQVVPVMQDWGGPIGLGYATRHPDKIAGLFLMNTWAFVKQEQLRLPLWFKALKAPRIGEHVIGKRNAYVEQVLPRITNVELSDEVMDAYRHPFTTEDSRTGVVQAARMVPDKPQNPNWKTMEGIEEALSGLQVPARIVWADSDPAFPKRFAWAFHELLPQAEEPFFLEGVGHYLQEEEPDLLVAEIAEFVQTLHL